MRGFIPILLALLLTATTHAKTLTFYVGDLTMEAPYFTNAPEFNLNGSFYGNNPIGTSKTQSRRKFEKELIDLMWERYPEAKSIKIFRNTLMVTL